jgi:hypothetical protein
MQLVLNRVLRPLEPIFGVVVLQESNVGLECGPPPRTRRDERGLGTGRREEAFELAAQIQSAAYSVGCLCRSPGLRLGP